MDNQKFYLDISWTSILKIAVAIFALYLLYLTGPILIWILFALIISMLFAPVIDFLEGKRIPRAISVVLIYGGVFGLVGFLIYLTIPIFVSEIKQLSQSFHIYFEKFSPPFRGLGIEAFKNIESFIETIERTLTKIAPNFFSALFSIFGGIFSTLFVITIGIFLSLERKPIEKAILLLSPKKYEKDSLVIWNKCQKKISGWFLSRIIACLFIAAATYIAFFILKIEYPIFLAVLAGFFNFIPFIGAIFAGLLIFLVSFFENPLIIPFLAVLAFVLIQLIENNIITPFLTKKFVGLSPTMTLTALVIGGKLWGLLGAILAIPLFAVIVEFVKDFLKMRKERESGARTPPQEPKRPIIF